MSFVQCCNFLGIHEGIYLLFLGILSFLRVVKLFAYHSSDGYEILRAL